MNSPRLAPLRPLIIIPARTASTRLPGKPLADIHGEPMIVHVWKRAMESEIGTVLVACDGKEIASAVEKAGGKAVLTKPDHPSGSDRIWEALHAVENNALYDAVINLQGDLPAIAPEHIIACWELLRDASVDIGTLATEIHTEQERNATQVVKAVLDMPKDGTKARALYFSRAPVPAGEGPLYHHVGIYAYRRDALARFVMAPPSPLEMREKLEQLRALSLGMRIEARLIGKAPLGVDTQADLEKAREVLKKK